jgi:hypothetical protein
MLAMLARRAEDFLDHLLLHAGGYILEALSIFQCYYCAYVS